MLFGCLYPKWLNEQCLPFEIKVPNAETLQAMAELEAGEGHKSYSVAEFMAELNADD